MTGNVVRGLKTRSLYASLEYADRRAGRQLTLVLDRRDRIGPRDIILVTCLRNECVRMPAFVEHYRHLGVKHFLVIDNDSDDGLIDWASKEPDVSVWHTGASYRDSRFGMLWCNDLLRRHGVGRWCVTVDPDEFLTYPNMTTRSLAALTDFLAEEDRPCLHALLLDAYSDRPLAETLLEPAADPFALCPYFDGDGYIQSPGWGGGTWIQGGPRMRVHFRSAPEEAPALNKIPLVFWQRHYHYRMSTHDAWPLRLNKAHKRGEVSVSGVLFHFKFVASLREKAREEAVRGEHYAGGREYERYRRDEADELYEEGISRRYEGPAQLVELGLMSAGRWF